MKTNISLSRADHTKIAIAALAIFIGVALLRCLTTLQERFGKGG